MATIGKATPSARPSNARLQGPAGRRLAVGTLLTGSVPTALIFVALMPVLPMIAAHFAGRFDGTFLAQMVMTIPAIGLIVGGLITPVFTRRFGPERVLYAALAAFALFGSAGLYVESPWALLGSRLLLGLAASMAAIAMTAIIARRFTGDRRAAMLGYKNGLSSVAGISGILVAGWLASVGGWRLPFAMYLLPLFILPLAWLSLGTRSAPAAGAAGSGKDTPGETRLVRLWPIYGLAIVFTIVVMMNATQLVFLLSEIGVPDPGSLSQIIVIPSVTSTIASLSYGALRRRIGASLCPVVAMAFWSAGLTTLGLSGSVATAAIGAAGAGFAGGLFLPHLSATLLERASPLIHDRAIGLLYSAIFLGDFLNPVIIEPLSRTLSRHGAFLGVGIFCGLWLAGLIVSHARRPRTMETAL